MRRDLRPRPRPLALAARTVARLGVTLSIASGVAACGDRASPVSPTPLRPAFDVSALAVNSTMGAAPRDLGAINVPGSANQVCNATPVRGPGEPTGGSAATWLGEKINKPAHTFVAGGFQLTVSADQRSLSWTSVAGGTYAGTSNVMTAILVKAGNNSSVYYYNPSFTTDGDGVPPNSGSVTTNPNDQVIRADANLGGAQQAIGHIVICYVERLFNPTISLEMRGSPDFGLVGDVIDYSITITNTSPAGTPDLACEYTSPFGNKDTFTFGPGDMAAYVAGQEIQSTDSDPLVATVSVTCTMPGDPTPITATASHGADIVTIDFDFEMTGPATIAVGGTAEYTFTVKNVSPSDTPPVPCRLRDDLTGLNKTFTIASGDEVVEQGSYVVQATDPNPLLNDGRLSCSFSGLVGKEINRTVSTAIVQ